MGLEDNLIGAALPGGECLLGSVVPVCEMHVGDQFGFLGLLLPWALVSWDSGSGIGGGVGEVAAVDCPPCGECVSLVPCSKLFFFV